MLKRKIADLSQKMKSRHKKIVAVDIIHEVVFQAIHDIVAKEQEHGEYK